MFLVIRNHCQCDEMLTITHRWRHLYLLQHQMQHIAQTLVLTHKLVQDIRAHHCRQSRKPFSLNNTGPTRKASILIHVIEAIIIVIWSISIQMLKIWSIVDHVHVHLQTLPMNRGFYKAFRVEIIKKHISYLIAQPHKPYAFWLVVIAKIVLQFSRSTESHKL